MRPSNLHITFSKPLHVFYVPKSSFQLRYLTIQKTSLLTSMSITKEVICRLQLKTESSQETDGSLVSLKDSPHIPLSTREKWATQITTSFQPGSENTRVIRAWDLIFNLDGSIESRSEPSLADEKFQYIYPAHYRIPSDTISDLSQEEQVRRAELFAVGSILYAIYSSKEPFEQFTDEQVQSRFRNGEVPEDILAFSSWPIILSCWSIEFDTELQKTLRKTLHSLHEIGLTTT